VNPVMELPTIPLTLSLAMNKHAGMPVVLDQTTLKAGNIGHTQQQEVDISFSLH